MAVRNSYDDARAFIDRIMSISTQSFDIESRLDNFQFIERTILERLSRQLNNTICQHVHENLTPSMQLDIINALTETEAEMNNISSDSVIATKKREIASLRESLTSLRARKQTLQTEVSLLQTLSRDEEGGSYNSEIIKEVSRSQQLLAKVQSDSRKRSQGEGEGERGTNTTTRTIVDATDAVRAYLSNNKYVGGNDDDNDAALTPEAKRAKID